MDPCLPRRGGSRRISPPREMRTAPGGGSALGQEAPTPGRALVAQAALPPAPLRQSVPSVARLFLRARRRCCRPAAMPRSPPAPQLSIGRGRAPGRARKGAAPAGKWKPKLGGAAAAGSGAGASIPGVPKPSGGKLPGLGDGKRQVKRPAWKHSNIQEHRAPVLTSLSHHLLYRHCRLLPRERPPTLSLLPHILTGGMQLLCK